MGKLSFWRLPDYGILGREVFKNFGIWWCKFSGSEIESGTESLLISVYDPEVVTVLVTATTNFGSSYY